MDTVKVLDTLFASHSVTIGGDGDPEQVVQIHRVSLRVMEPALNLIKEVMADLEMDVQRMPTIDVGDPEVILKLVSKHYMPVVEVAAALSSLSVSELLDLPLDASLLVIGKVATVNKSFFMEKVKGVLESLESALLPPAPANPSAIAAATT